MRQGFRKYVHQATDHEELLSFLLGQLIKERVQLYRHQRGENPERVQVKVSSELRPFVAALTSRLGRWSIARKSWKSTISRRISSRRCSSPMGTRWERSTASGLWEKIFTRVQPDGEL